MAETFQIAPGEEALLACHGLTGLEAVFGFSEGQRLDKAGLEGWRQRWRLDLPDGCGDVQTLYLKRFERPPLRRQWERWRQGHGRLSTAGVEWTNARLLADAGIPAVRPVALGQSMIGPWERRSFILMREVAGESLERWVPLNLPPIRLDGDLEGRRRRLEGLARLVASLHRAGFVHRDLYLSHIFMERTEGGRDAHPPISGGVRDAHLPGEDGGRDAHPPEGGQNAHPPGDGFRLIDLQRVFRPRWRQRRWVIKDLAALHFSTPIERVGMSERLRFLCRYVRECGRFGPARVLARLIDRKTRRMARRRPELAVGLSPAGRMPDEGSASIK